MKRFIIFPLFAIFCIIFLIPLLSWAVPAGKITFIEGRVDVLKTGSNMAILVRQGDPVEAGDIYRAKSNGKAEITFANNNLLKIAPNTRIEIQEAMFQGDRSSSVVRLHRGRVQAISSVEFVKKVSSFAEGNKFEVHTPNAVAGIRGSNMVVAFLKGVTSTLFLKGFGYQYNPNDPQKRTITLTQGQISFIVTITSSPTPARNASEAEIMIQVQAVTPAVQSEGTASGSTGTTAAGGGGTVGPVIASSSGTQMDARTMLAALVSLFAPAAPPPPPPLPPTPSEGESGPSPTFQSIATGSLYTYTDSLVQEGFYYGLLKGYGSVWSATETSPVTTKIVNGDYTEGTQPSHVIGSDTTLYSYTSQNSTYTTYDGGAFYGYNGGYEVGSSITGKNILLYIDPSGNAGYLKGSYAGQGSPGTSKFNVNGTLYPVTMISAAGILPENLMSSTWAPSSGTGGLAGIFTSGGSLTGLTNLTFDTMAIYNRATNTAQNWGIYRFIDYGPYSNPSGSTAWSGKSGGTGIFGAAYGNSGFVDDRGRWIADITSGAWGSNAFTGTLSGKFMSYTRLGTIGGDLLGSYNSISTWQAMSLGTWSGTPLAYYGSLNPALWYTANGSAWTQSGALNGQMGSTSSLWGSTSTSPASLYLLGSYSMSGNPYHIFNYDVSSYNYKTGENTTYDSTPGSFRNMYAGIKLNDSIESKIAGLYIDPSGNAGFVRGGFIGLSYPQLLMWDGSGNMYTVQMATNIGITPKNLNDNIWSGTISGKISENFFSATGGGSSYNKTFSIYNASGNAAQPWGAWQMSLLGSYSSPSSSWTAKIGGEGVFGAYYASSFNNDSSYWIANISSGTWGANKLSGLINGNFISKTKLGNIAGDLLGAYNTNNTWQGVSIGTWSGTPLTLYSSLYAGLFYTSDGSTMSSDNSFTANLGSTASLWGTTSSSPASIYLMGQYPATSNSSDMFNNDMYSYNYKTSDKTTYDGGSFRNMYGGIKINNSIESKIAGIYIDPSGNAGFVKGGFTGVFYPQLLMWDASGNIYIAQMATSIGIAPKDLYTSIYNKTISGKISENFLSTGGGGTTYDRTFSIYNTSTNVAQPWGTWQISLLGTYASPPASWTAKIGGTGTFGAYYISSFNDDTGYWIADISSGTWVNSRAAGSISGNYITKTRLGTISGDLLGAYNTNNTWQGVSIGTWSGSDLGFLSCPSDIAFSFKYFNGSSMTTQSGSNSGYHGGPTGLWSSTQASPISTLMIGGYSAPSVTPSIWGSTLTSTNFKTSTTVTYDGGAYSGYLAGSEASGVFDARLAALSIDPSNNAGYIRGSLSGNGYSGISYFGMTNGSMYFTQKTASSGITPATLSSYINTWTDSGSSNSSSMSGAIGSGGSLSSYMTSNILLTTAAIQNTSTSVLPWGIYKFTDYGSFSNSSLESTWTGKVGGGGYGGYEAFGKYYYSGSPPSLQDDTGYWLTDLTSGTWTNSKMFAGLSGSFLTQTKLGTMTGDYIGSYNSSNIWQASSVGVWEGNDLSFFGKYYGFSQIHSTLNGLTGDGTMSFNLGGTSSLFGSTAVGVTVIGQYNPGSNSTYPNNVWSAPISSFNAKNLSTTNITYDGGAFSAFFGGTIIPGTTEAAMDARFYGLYEDASNNAGYVYGDLTGTGYKNIKMFGLTGTIGKTEIDTGLSGSPSTFTTANIGIQTFSGAGNILDLTVNNVPVENPNQYVQYNYVIEKGNWGTWQIIAGGQQTWSSTDNWDGSFLVKDSDSYNRIFGLEMVGSQWSSNKILGTAYGYGADTSFSTPITWISVGNIKGTYNPSDPYFQVVGMGPWIETNKFLTMAADTSAGGGQSKLQALNIPCVQVGVTTLIGSYAGSGALNFSINDAKFFSASSGGTPRIWASGSVTGTYDLAYGYAGKTGSISSGAGLTGSFEVKRWDSSKWSTTINGSGNYNGSGTMSGSAVAFKGAASGTYSAGSITSGTAAGTAKPGGGIY